MTVGILAAWLCVNTFQGITGDEILQQMDAAMREAEDQFMQFEALTKESGKADRSMSFQVTVKGQKWRRVDFLAPGNMKDMKVLILASDQMYVYLPAFKKVRRVASHVKEQGFMGSAYSQDEMSITSFSDLFAGKLKKETDSYWTVEATVRKGLSFPYAKIEVDVRRDIKQPAAIRFYNDKGQKIKSESRTGYTCKSKVCNPKKLSMTDHSRNDLLTELSRSAWRVNTKVPDSYFSVRALQRR